MKALKVKNSWLSDSDLRLDASYHLSDGPIAKAKLKSSPYKVTTLINECDRIFSGNIFKRTYVESDRNGWPYLTGSDMVKADINSGKYISKKYTTQAENLRIKKDWILISCSGTLGNCIYTNKDFDGRIGTHDLIRAIPNEKSVKKGFLYAYLASRYGYGLLTQSSYGGVVKHIEPHHIQDIPIPILPASKQEEINLLILEASSLRDSANMLLRGAQEKVTDTIALRPNKKSLKINVSSIFSSHQKRFESQYFISEGMEIKSHIYSLPHKLLKDVSKPIFRPGIFKRHYVKNGIDFLGGADIVKAIPRSDKKLSIAQTKHLESLKIKEDWILVTCDGTIGYSVLVNNYMAGKAASQHILRVIADKIPTGYLFAFMSSSLGLKAIQSFTYGSVIPQIEPHHLELLPIPILKEELMREVNSMVMDYKSKVSESIQKELKAIELVENEIESWQKS